MGGGMPTGHFNISTGKRGERGQTIILVVAALAIFLLAAIAFAVDYSNAWFHKQSAQNAADAACTAAVMDMLYATSNFAMTGTGALTDCNGNSDKAPCIYAAKNGYDGSTGNSVTFGYPDTITGVPACTGTPSPNVCEATGVVDNAYVSVTVTDHVPLLFAKMISPTPTVDVAAKANCGLVLSNAPIPILVLKPNTNGTMQLGGTGNVAKITITGGPSKSIQVNSSSATAVTNSGNPVVDLSHAGPQGAGGTFGVTGAEMSPGFPLNPLSGWQPKSSPINDPFANLAAPGKPGAPVVPADVTGCTTVPCSVPSGKHACPDPSGCTLYTPGYYSGGITIGHNTAIFDPGIYYLDGDFSAGSNSCVRPSDGSDTGGIQGTVFYLHSGNLSIDQNSGKSCPSNFNITSASGTGQLQYGIKCTSTSHVPPNLSGVTLDGNVLLGACTGIYGDPLGTDDPIGEQRGMVFFQNRDTVAANAQWGGNGSSAVIGTIYIHHCGSTAGAEKGTKCVATAFDDTFGLQGTAGSTSYVAGEIVTDKLDMGGTPNLDMYLNPNALYYVLKATLLP